MATGINNEVLKKEMIDIHKKLLLMKKVILQMLSYPGTNFSK